MMLIWILLGLATAYVVYGLVAETPFVRRFPDGLSDDGFAGDYLRPQEVIEADETAMTPRVASAVASDTLRRPKNASHDDPTFHEPHWGHTSGLLRGELVIDRIENLPAAFRVGLFAVEADYPVVARCGVTKDPVLGFSVNRIALKLETPTPVPNVHAESGTAHELDLLLVEGEPRENGDGHVFFARDGRQLDLATSIKPPSSRTLKALSNWRNLQALLWVRANVARGMKHARRAPTNSTGWAGKPYYSLGPFALGDGMMKFNLTPLQPHPVEEADPMTGDFGAVSKARMDGWLAAGEDARFTLGVQIATPDCIPEPGRNDPPKSVMAAEYCDLHWDEAVAPYIPVGTLTLHADDAINDHLTAGAIQFNAWNTLPEMRPLGQLFRMRKAVHRAHSDARVTHLFSGTPGAMTGKCPFS